MIEKVYGLQSTGVTLNARFTMLAVEAATTQPWENNNHSCCNRSHSAGGDNTKVLNGSARQKILQRANSMNNINRSGRPLARPAVLRLQQQRQRQWQAWRLQQLKKRQQQLGLRRRLFARLGQGGNIQGKRGPNINRWRQQMRNRNQAALQNNRGRAQRISNIARWYANRRRMLSKPVQGVRGQQSRPSVTREQLDAELEQYMSTTRAALDRQLDEYMANVDQPFAL